MDIECGRRAGLLFSSSHLSVYKSGHIVQAANFWLLLCTDLKEGGLHQGLLFPADNGDDAVRQQAFVLRGARLHHHYKM